MKNTEIAIGLIMEDFKERYLRALQDNNVNASGNLSDKTGVNLISNETFVSGSVLSPNYWRYPNFGRGGATKSTASKGEVKKRIRQWIDDKNLPAWKRKKKDGTEGKTMSKDEQAFLITRKIQREGYKGKEFVQPIIEEIQPTVDELISEAVFKDLNILLT
jgi:hypothetical protein